jgi:hypothetical protein
MALIEHLGNLPPHLPALGPPHLLDLVAGVLMGHKLLPPSLDNAPEVLDWLRFRFCYGINQVMLQNQLSTEAVDKLGLTNLESNSRSKFEVDWLFFAQADYFTYSRYRADSLQLKWARVLDCGRRRFLFGADPVRQRL